MNNYRNYYNREETRSMVEWSKNVGKVQLISVSSLDEFFDLRYERMFSPHMTVGGMGVLPSKAKDCFLSLATQNHCAHELKLKYYRICLSNEEAAALRYPNSNSLYLIAQNLAAHLAEGHQVLYSVPLVGLPEIHLLVSNIDVAQGKAIFIDPDEMQFEVCVLEDILRELLMRYINDSMGRPDFLNQYSC